MTREEAILLLHDMKDTYDEIHENTNYEIGYEQMTALDMAIEALTYQNLSKPNNTCEDDLIRREDAIDAVLELNTDGRVSWKDAVIDMLDALSSATGDDCIWHVCNYNKIDWDGEDGYISRQDAIRWVKTECNPYGKPTLDFESGKKVIEHLEQMPSAEPKTGWIPVSERLPENSGCVLISIAGDIEFGAYDRQNSDWAIWQGDYWGEGKRADAWMPLPEPYREDGE